MPAALDLDDRRFRPGEPQWHANRSRRKSASSRPAIATIRSPAWIPALAAARVGLDRADDVRGWRPDQGEERREDEDREQEIGGWSGKDDEEALPDRPDLESPVAQLLGGMSLEVAGIARRGHVADELDIAAERQPADFPARALLVGPAEHFAPEADREGLGRNPEPARDEIMAKLVEEDERARARRRRR